MKITTGARMFITGVAVGAAAVYFSDPDRGEARRRRVAERAAELRATTRAEVVADRVAEATGWDDDGAATDRASEDAQPVA